MSEQQVNEATASETLVSESPVSETPVSETPASESPTSETPTSETPVSESPTSETPASETPANDPAANDVPAAPVEQAATPEAAPAAAVEQADTAEGAPVVRMLSVGQQVKGTVKRITEFGAFVDIGVGRDGLVHISELSAKRVGKVSDVLQDGQEVQLWIKKLDRDRNRISLTMIEPGKRTIRDLQKGEVVEGTVTRLLPYGAFIDIGIGRDALLHVREMGEGFIAKPEDVVQVGQTVEVRVIDIARRRSRVDLSMKGLRPEPEVQTPAHEDRQEQQGYQERREGYQERRGRQGRQPEPEPELPPEPELADDFADVEVLTPMQLAFKRAQEKSGVVLPTGKPNKHNRHQDTSKKRAQQEDIMARTLNSSNSGKK